MYEVWSILLASNHHLSCRHPKIRNAHRLIVTSAHPPSRVDMHAGHANTPSLDLSTDNVPVRLVNYPTRLAVLNPAELPGLPGTIGSIHHVLLL